MKDRCALRTLPDPATDGTPTPLLPLLPNSSASFHNFSQLATSLQKPEILELSAWLHEKFHGLGAWKTLSCALLELVASRHTVDY